MGNAVVRVECVNCSTGSELGLALAGVAIVVAVIALAVAMVQARLARVQTELAKAQTRLTATQADHSAKQMEMAEREHAVFMEELRRQPKLTLRVRLPDGASYDGEIDVPLGEEWSGLLEVRLDNDGPAKATGVVVNVLGPIHLRCFQWSLSSGAIDAEEQAPDPIPAGEQPLFSPDGMPVATQYLSKSLEVMRNSVNTCWVNVVVDKHVAVVPLRVTVNHDQSARTLVKELVVRRSEPGTAQGAPSTTIPTTR